MNTYFYTKDKQEYECEWTCCLGRVGAVVEGTYCETVFQDCREQSCFVQSPGFPGVYPRGISCRWTRVYPKYPSGKPEYILYIL